jgi:hypothetical protein
MLDKVANSLEAQGLIKEAYEIDKISNQIDSDDWQRFLPEPFYSKMFLTKRTVKSELLEMVDGKKVVEDLDSLEGLLPSKPFDTYQKWMLEANRQGILERSEVFDIYRVLREYESKIERKKEVEEKNRKFRE